MKKTDAKLKAEAMLNAFECAKKELTQTIELLHYHGINSCSGEIITQDGTKYTYYIADEDQGEADNHAK